MRFLFLSALCLGGCATTPAPTTETRAASWWADVSLLASDEMAGRAAGTDDYRAAADHVRQRFAALGLEPAGDQGGWYQEVALEERTIAREDTSAALVADGSVIPLSIPDDLYFRVRGGAPPERVDAPMVFVGYGLHIPEADHDDFAGVDLRGKVAVFVSGGPARISGALKSHARDQRARLLVERGAVAAISLTTPGQAEGDWARTAPILSAQPGAYFADQGLREPGPLLQANVNPASAERLFARSGRSFAEIAALADASGPVPGFALDQSLRARVASSVRRISAPNIVARLPGRDPALGAEHVMLSAHLDGLGVNPTGEGDRINNGALDNAAGVAALIDIATQLRRQRPPRRSILFVVVTAEERGLLGSRYFARRPTVPPASIVANLNYDMALPIFPLRSVIALGAEESSLGADARTVGRALGLPLAPDPFPNRNSFIRSDQYSFIEQGIPSLAFKFGFAANTPEAELERMWRATRYHAPSDDLAQPVMREDSIRLHDFIAALATRIADVDRRPRWNDDSFFRRFVRHSSQGEP